MLINLLSNPRNLSTALMYSFAQRADTHAVDEPFYGVYLHKTKLEHPGAAAVMASMPTNEQMVWQQLEQANTKPNLFIKNMAHHMRELQDLQWLQKATHIVYIRHPQQIIHSFAKVIANPTINDVGIKDQWDWIQYLSKNDIPFVVLNSQSILNNPQDCLENLCHAIGISFDPNMLTWPAGPKACDGVWATYWYENVHKSTGFSKSPLSLKPLPNNLTDLLNQCMPYFESAQKIAI